jgi:hypothetical protein
VKGGKLPPRDKAPWWDVSNSWFFTILIAGAILLTVFLFLIASDWMTKA